MEKKEASTPTWFEKREIKQKERHLVKQYRQESKQFLLTSRFTNDTWKQNEEFRKSKKKTGCVYCSPTPITNEIPHEAVLFILEMNNDTNEILGIGMAKNCPKIYKYSVYNNGNYNRYVFEGHNRIDRSEMTEQEETVMQIFDILCFQGNTHMKRGSGISSFPTIMLHRCRERFDLVDFIKTMFKQRLITKTISS
jgi:hypothetical protein